MGLDEEPVFSCNLGAYLEPEEVKGPEIKMILQVDLNDLYVGKVIEVEIDKQVICNKCDGSGAKSSSDVKVCSACNGRGVRVIKQMLAPGIYQRMQTTYFNTRGVSFET